MLQLFCVVCSGVRDLTKQKLIQWLRLRTPVLVNIFHGDLFSQRHDDYLAGAKKRGERLLLGVCVLLSV